ncbi:pyridinium-3,5-biscarboxylic acid mononucleotide sulfurtransferase [Desulfarculales bacterium]
MPRTPLISPDLQDSWQSLLDRLRQLAPLLVAFSGGVDSTLLLAAATQVLGPGVRAAICLGAFTPPWEAARARQIAAQLGTDLVELDADEMAVTAIRQNDPERCYHCKLLRLTLLIGLARERDLKSVVEGSQLDDARDYRPGSRAVTELGVHSPLAEAGLDKVAVRRLSQALGLITADLPSEACLATRVATGIPLDPATLARIGRAEEAVRALLPGQVRVRDHLPMARLELEPRLLAQAVAEPQRGRLLTCLQSLGYKVVCLDLAGYQASGLASAAPAPDR